MQDAFGNSQGTFQSGYESGLAEARREAGQQNLFDNARPVTPNPSSQGGVFGAPTNNGFNPPQGQSYKSHTNNYEIKEMPTQSAGGYEGDYTPGDMSSNPTYISGDGVTSTRLHDNPMTPLDPETGKPSLNTAGTLALGTASMAGAAALDRAMVKRAAANASPEMMRDAARFNAQRGHSEYNRYLNSRADRALADEMARGGSEAGRAAREGATSAARETAKREAAEEAAERAAARAAEREAGKQAGKQGARMAAKQAGKQVAEQAGRVATRGATRAAVGVAGRLGARGALMAAGATIPGPGWAFAAAVASTIAIEAMFNPGFRSWCKGLLRSGGVAVDTPPEPPETHWLPNVNKDKREDVVKAVDATLTDLNDQLTGIDPDVYKMWDVTGGNQVPGLTRMLPVTDQINLVADQLNTFSENVTGVLNGTESSILKDYATELEPSMKVLGTFNQDAGKPLSDAIIQAATTSNEAYQLLLDANQRSREALAQSSGDILHVIPHSSLEQKDLTTNQVPIKEKVEELKNQQRDIANSINRWLEQIPDVQVPKAENYPAPIGQPGPNGIIPNGKDPMAPKINEDDDSADPKGPSNPTWNNPVAPGATPTSPISPRGGAFPGGGGGGGAFPGGGGSGVFGGGGSGSSPIDTGRTNDVFGGDDSDDAKNKSLPDRDGGIFGDSTGDEAESPIKTGDGSGIFDDVDKDADTTALPDTDGSIFDTDGTDGEASSDLGIDDGSGIFDSGSGSSGSSSLPSADNGGLFGSDDLATDSGPGLGVDGGSGDTSDSGPGLGVDNGSGGLFGSGDTGSSDIPSTSGGGIFGDGGGSSLPGYGDTRPGLGISDGSSDIFGSGDDSSTFDPSSGSRGLGAFGSNGLDSEGNPLPHTGDTVTTSGSDSAFKPDDELDDLFGNDESGFTDGSTFDPEADTIGDGSGESSDPFGSTDEDYDPFGGENADGAATGESAEVPEADGGSAFDGGSGDSGAAGGGGGDLGGGDGNNIFGDDSAGDTGVVGEPTEAGADGAGGDGAAGGEGAGLPEGDVPQEGDGLFDDMYDENGELKDPSVRAADMNMTPEEAKEAMTVDINGEQVQFLNPETADLARSILDPAVDTSNIPFDDLAESAGLTPGEGESIGVPISPAEAQPGDVMTVDGKDWLYVGNEQVIDPATGDIGQVSDLAANGFSGEGEGFFRLDNEEGAMLDEAIGGAVEGEEPAESTSASESASETSETASATDSASATESGSSPASATESATASESATATATPSASESTTGSTPVDTPTQTPQASESTPADQPADQTAATDYRRSEEAPIGMGAGQNVPMDTGVNPVEGGGASAGGVEAGEGGSYADGQTAEADTSAASGITETEFEGEALGGSRPQTHTSGAESIPAPGKMDPDSII
jgi:hypothetical protein